MSDFSRRDLLASAAAGGLGGPGLLGARGSGGTRPPSPDASLDARSSDGAGAEHGLRADLSAAGGGDLVNQRPAGVAGDGIASDRAAFRALPSGIVVPRGTYFFDEDTEIDVSVHGLPGMRFKTAPGKKLVFRGGFSGAAERLFTDGASIDLSRARLTEAYAEWWGAKADEPAMDNRAALTAALASGAPILQLLAGDYWLGGRWQVANSYRRIRGVGRHGQGGATPCTRILHDKPDEDVIHVGTFASPGAIDDFVQYVDLQNLTVLCTVGPTPSVSGITGGQAIVRGRFILNCGFEEVEAINGCHGFNMNGAVYSEIRRCAAQRLHPDQNAVGGAASAADFYVGVMLDATPSIDANTGIASFYVDKIGVTGTTNTRASHGLYTANGMTDMFIEKVETSGVDFGVQLNGNASAEYGSEDGWVRGCVLDQCLTCITVNAGQATEAITIQGNYGATRFATPGSTAVVYSGSPTTGRGGSVSLIGNQFVGNGNGSIGLDVADSRGLIAHGNIWTDFVIPQRFQNASHCRVTDRICNPGTTAQGGAVSAANSARLVIDNAIDGKPDAFLVGADLQGTANTTHEIRTSGIDVGCLRDGASAKLRVNGRNVALSDGVTAFAGGIAIGLAG